MGGTTSSTVDNINSSISNNIMTSIQKSQTNINVQQNISGTCDTEIIQNLSTKYTDCIIGMADKFPSDKVLDICSVYTTMCKMNDIDLNNLVQ